MILIKLLGKLNIAISKFSPIFLYFVGEIRKFDWLTGYRIQFIVIN